MRPASIFLIIQLSNSRAVTMLLELGGVWLLVEYLQLPDMLGKFLVQFLVLILNYLFSRFFVFTRGKTKS